jgi:PIN domain nuclease of toxin-antitoxin system
LRLLLDTHVALWAVADAPRLSQLARQLLLDADNTVSVSAASAWEIAIKHPLRRPGAAAFVMSAHEALEEFAIAGYGLLPITAVEAASVATLPPHHHDPFDRLIVAQALSGPYRLLTHDEILARYSDTVTLV